MTKIPQKTSKMIKIPPKPLKQPKKTLGIQKLPKYFWKPTK
jgi:hypothetical protein